jgi:uncharacterized protein YjiS (DUF1127 family)
MKSSGCMDTLGWAPRLPAAPPALGRLWLGWLASRLRRLPDQVLMGLERSRQRRQLGQLDQRMLRDIGVSRSAAFAETRKWFWQP